jgi:hypothetical protein
LRVRYGYEKNALETNKATIFKYLDDIDTNIESYERKIDELEEEQMKEIARKYRSEVAKMKKTIEERKAKSGDDGESLKTREAELRHHLELITNIAQRIDSENRALRKKNIELKSDYKVQQTEREKLVKQLVLQKKEN